MSRPRTRGSVLTAVTAALFLLGSVPVGAALSRVDFPPARYGMRMAYDGVRRQVVLFGGYDDFHLFADTWTWDGAGWTKQHPAASPSARYGFGMAYDAARRQVVLFGGYDGNDRNDTWTWGGRTWTEQHPQNVPPARSPIQLAYDAARRQVLLWDWDPYNPEEGGQTWAWDGSDWVRLHPATYPPYWDGYRMAYDGANQEVLLFGGGSCGDLGCTFNHDTWTWDGRTWGLLHPPAAPRPRESMGIAYDGARKQVVLFGGLGKVVYGDTWIWDGTTWTCVLECPP